MATATQTKRKRYPGSKPFTRDDETLFFGRDEDIAKLVTFIKVEKSTVLYGKSGLGKTSLLSAGVLPRLINEHKYYVIPIRFGSYTEDNLKHPLDIIEEEVARLDRRGTFLDKIESEAVSLWQHIKSLERTLPDRTTLLLVFDQFEELFTYPEGVADFAEALADLLYSRIPKDFQRALRLATRKDPDLLTVEECEFLESPVNLKVLMSIRSDRMSLLDRLSSHIPSILLNCYELNALSWAQAEDAIKGPTRKDGEFLSAPFDYRPEALEKILNYLTHNKTKPIESFQLQILCQHVEDNIVIANGDTCVEADDLGDLEMVYQNFYNNSIKKLGPEDEQLKAQVLIEEGLILEKERRRMTLHEGQVESLYNIGPDFLRRLADTHIIRSEPYSGGGYLYEISHDTLVPPILKAKASRYERQKEERSQRLLAVKKRKRKKKIVRAIALFVALPFLFVLGLLILMKSLGDYQDYKDDPLVAMYLAILVFSLFFLILGALTIIGFFYEFITGESVLSKLRKRAEDPNKQKGFLTKVGGWLS